MKVLKRLLVFAFMLKVIQVNATNVVVSTAYGYNSTDATTFLQNALNSTADTVIINNVGSDWVTQPLFINRNNLTVILERGVILRAKSNTYTVDWMCLLSMTDRTGIKIIGYGATMTMPKSEFTTEEHRHALNINGCTNVTIAGLYIKDSGGDGIYLGVRNAARDYNLDIVIRDVVCDNHRRQGISVISAQNLLIEGCLLKNTSGTAPQSGIDWEPNAANERLVNCVMRNTRSEDNVSTCTDIYLDKLAASSLPVSLTIENCNFTGTLGRGIKAANVRSNVDGVITFNNCSISNVPGLGLQVEDKSVSGLDLIFNNCTWEKTGGTASWKTMVIWQSSTSIASEYGKVALNNCLTADSKTLNFIEGAGLEPQGLGCGYISGNVTVVNTNSSAYTYNFGSLAHNITIGVNGRVSIPSTTVSVTGNKTQMAEGDSLTVTVTRSSSDLTFPLPVQYTISGSATNRDDYQGLTGVVVIPKDASSATFKVRSRLDSDSESSETVTVTLASGAFISYSIGSPSSVTCTITNAAIVNTTVNFEDRPTAETKITGTYANIGWGTNNWATLYNASVNTKFLEMWSNSTSEVTKTFTLPANKVLKSLKLIVFGNPSTKQIVLSSTGNPTLTWTNITSSFTTYQTNWTVAASTITVKITCSSGASNLNIDDLVYGDPQ